MSQPNGSPNSTGEPDSDGYFTDEFGEVITKADLHEREAREEMEMQGIRDMIKNREQNRLEWLQNANPIAYTIPKEVYERAWKQPESLTDDDCDLILSRGDIQSRALIDAKGLLTQAERYTILGWPSPDVVTKNIRAATKDMETPLSTPLELVEKAERDGVGSLPPKAIMLVTNKFHEGDEVEIELGTEKELNVNSLAIPGNNEAANLALKAEGLDLMKLGIFMMYYAARTMTESEGMQAESQAQPAASLPSFQAMLTALQSGEPFDPEQLLGAKPFGQAMAAQDAPTSQTASVPPVVPSQQRASGRASAHVGGLGGQATAGLGSATTASASGESEPQMPGSFPRESQTEPSSSSMQDIQQEFSGSFQRPLRPYEFKPDGPQVYVPVYPRTQQFPVPGTDENGIPPIPEPLQTFRVIDELADSLSKIKDDHDKGRMNKAEFGEAFNNIVHSMRGFSLRFKSSREVDIPPGEARQEEMRQRRRIYPEAPRLQVVPNPFGLRLTHDGRDLSQTKKDAAFGQLPPAASQMPPWSPWSPVIPHHGMRKPTSIPRVSHGELIAVVNEWTINEEAARKKDLAEGREPPPFHETPPLWPASYTQKRAFNIYHESVMETEEAQAWPEGDINYASTKWEAMSPDEQAVNAGLCEERRRMAWLDSLNRFPNHLGYWKK